MRNGKNKFGLLIGAAILLSPILVVKNSRAIEADNFCKLTAGGFGPCPVTSGDVPRVSVEQASPGFPASTATQVIVSASGTTLAVVATMPAVSGKTNFLCDLSSEQTATAGIIGGITITGLLGGTRTYFAGVGTSPVVSQTNRNFYPCIPASAVNTAIVFTTGAAGAGGNVSMNVDGFVQ
jgi:hypothetical protein